MTGRKEEGTRFIAADHIGLVKRLSRRYFRDHFSVSSQTRFSPAGSTENSLRSAKGVNPHHLNCSENLSGKISPRVTMSLTKTALRQAVLFSVFSCLSLSAADQPFHDAPASAKSMKNPYEGQAAAVDAGKTLYA